MRRDIFGDLIAPPRLTGSQSWVAVLTTMAIEIVAIAALVITPLMVVGLVPKPPSILAFAVATPPPPPPPPPVAARPDTQVVEKIDNGAPIEPPPSIAPEPEVVADGIANTLDAGTVIGGSITVEPPPTPPAVTVPVRVGGNIKPPAKTRDVLPIYPTIAMISRTEGIVILEAVIDTDGSVRDAKVLRSIPLLDQSALDAVRQWQFTPSLLNGQPIPVIMTITVRFSLQKN